MKIQRLQIWPCLKVNGIIFLRGLRIIKWLQLEVHVIAWGLIQTLFLEWWRNSNFYLSVRSWSMIRKLLIFILFSCKIQQDSIWVILVKWNWLLNIQLRSAVLNKRALFSFPIILFFYWFEIIDWKPFHQFIQPVLHFRNLLICRIAQWLILFNFGRKVTWRYFRRWWRYWNFVCFIRFLFWKIIILFHNDMIDLWLKCRYF